MSQLAIIGGTGLNQLEGLTITRRRVMRTPYGEPSGPLTYGEYNGREVVFIPRHGPGHTIPPHNINYRANLWALKDIGIEQVIACAAVGGIHPAMPPSTIAIPDQIVDYTHGRESTFHDGGHDKVVHIDFTYPYDEALRQTLISAAENADQTIFAGGTYGATQGPRLETAAEINRMEKDGCDMVGMTGMPEAALARELDLAYATIAVVANYAAGRGDEGEISMKVIEAHLHRGMESVKKILISTLKQEPV